MDGPDKPGHDNLVFEFEKRHELGPLTSAREGRASPGMTSGNKKARGVSRGRNSRCADTVRVDRDGVKYSYEEEYLV